MPQSSTLQDAIRLLFIFFHGSEPLINHPEGFTRVFESRVKAFAMDFWVRYPDFLCHELLNRFEISKEGHFLDLAREIIDNDEPDLRTIPMIRYRFGAYEDLTETIALLKTKGLLHEDGTKTTDRILHYEYYFTPLGEQVIQDIRKEFEVLRWYDDRAALVKEICGNLRGSELKQEQYKHMTYASTTLGGIIPSIKEDVIKRLNNIS
jgi:hypothetical protein